MMVELDYNMVLELGYMMVELAHGSVKEELIIISLPILSNRKIRLHSDCVY